MISTWVKVWYSRQIILHICPVSLCGKNHRITVYRKLWLQRSLLLCGDTGTTAIMFSKNNSGLMGRFTIINKAFLWNVFYLTKARTNIRINDRWSEAVTLGYDVAGNRTMFNSGQSVRNTTTLIYDSTGAMSYCNLSPNEQHSIHHTVAAITLQPDPKGKKPMSMSTMGWIWSELPILRTGKQTLPIILMVSYWLFKMQETIPQVLLTTALETWHLPQTLWVG
jgi:hypothetical protein